MTAKHAQTWSVRCAQLYKSASVTLSLISLPVLPSSPFFEILNVAARGSTLTIGWGAFHPFRLLVLLSIIL